MRGPVTADNLRERGITTVGQVAELAEAALVSMLGPASKHVVFLPESSSHLQLLLPSFTRAYCALAQVLPRRIWPARHGRSYPLLLRVEARIQ